ncbi:phage gp6-like head-tail connector protein [Bacillus methanolicus]|uniref:head-tail connector protein n=1 Tax=Bacillus methanolicus TaxID=1471 RepID=UPI00200D26EC|nr:head-tail connector protein [Bacillus methanolicus]UQD53308.1 phage gp6-like head-tail connector protein [Bacillus methanolicus]
MLNLIDFVKQHVRIDESEDDTYLTLLIDAAKANLKISGVREREEEDPLYPLYQIAVAIQVLLDYDKYDKFMNVEALKKALLEITLKLKDYGEGTS